MNKTVDELLGEYKEKYSKIDRQTSIDNAKKFWGEVFPLLCMDCGATWEHDYQMHFSFTDQKSRMHNTKSIITAALICLAQTDIDSVLMNRYLARKPVDEICQKHGFSKTHFYDLKKEALFQFSYSAKGFEDLPLLLAEKEQK